MLALNVLYLSQSSVSKYLITHPVGKSKVFPYLPKVGDVVCAKNSPTITDYGLYAATIEYIQTMDTSAPYAILGVAGVTFTKYYLTNSAFVTTINTGGSGAGNVNN